MRIIHNMAAIYGYNALQRNSGLLEKSVEKLATGLRIGSAADDAAGLGISEKMRAQIRGLDQSTRNTQDGISLIQTAEGALNESHSLMQRMRELSVQAANDTLTANDRIYIQEEIDQLTEELGRIATTTQFNKKKLLDGTAAMLWSSSRGDVEVFAQAGTTSLEIPEGNYTITVMADPGRLRFSNPTSSPSPNRRLWIWEFFLRALLREVLDMSPLRGIKLLLPPTLQAAIPSI